MVLKVEESLSCASYSKSRSISLVRNRSVSDLCFPSNKRRVFYSTVHEKEGYYTDFYSLIVIQEDVNYENLTDMKRRP